MARYTRIPSTGQGSRKPKIFVLDTNIILHDFKAIRKFKGEYMTQYEFAEETRNNLLKNY